MLGAESCGLPDELAGDVSRFFDANIDWLVAILEDDADMIKRRRRAIQIVATLQGAMMIATSMQDHDIFDGAVAQVLAD